MPSSSKVRYVEKHKWNWIRLRIWPAPFSTNIRERENVEKRARGTQKKAHKRKTDVHGKCFYMQRIVERNAKAMKGFFPSFAELKNLFVFQYVYELKFKSMHVCECVCVSMCLCVNHYYENSLLKVTTFIKIDENSTGCTSFM